MLVDTTEDDNRVLHFLQTDFKADGDKTGIASDAQPKFPYKAPGSFGESGQRQYSFLLYQQRGSFSASNMPTPGKAFDVKSFQSANSLKDPLAGNVMEVDTDDSNTGAGNKPPNSPSASGSEAQASTSVEQQTQGSRTIDPAVSDIFQTTFAKTTSMATPSSRHAAATAPTAVVSSAISETSQARAGVQSSLSKELTILTSSRQASSTGRTITATAESPASVDTASTNSATPPAATSNSTNLSTQLLRYFSVALCSTLFTVFA
ncbi:MAG: hypothetical protein MMC23_009246 [Stictis urceolatum]|nr:hypothetical protein [Stictis urceolata]